MEKCCDRITTTPPTGKSALELIDLVDLTLDEIDSLAISLATLCSEGNFERIHSSLKMNDEYNFAPATTLQENCKTLRGQLQRQVRNYSDVREWLVGREIYLPSHAAWKRTRRSFRLSAQEEFVETILKAIRRPDSDRSEKRQRRYVKSVPPPRGLPREGGWKTC